jgi:hypothetical protein
MLITLIAINVVTAILLPAPLGLLNLAVAGFLAGLWAAGRL